MLNRLFRGKFIIINLFLLTWLTSCERINHSAESENFERAKEFLYFQHASLIAIQLVEHVNSTGSSQGLNSTMMDSLSKQLKSTYFITDSSYLDNNGIEYQLLFNSQNSSGFNPYVHFTSYALDGNLKVIVDQNYREINSKSTIIISENNPFSIEYPSFGKVSLFGTLELERIQAYTIRITYKDFKIKYDSDIFDLNYQLEYSWISGGETDGLWFDNLVYSGKGKLEEEGEENENSEFEIINPLIKNFEPGCSDYFQKGSLILSSHDGKFNIDFDPFNNGACSSLVRITNGKKEKEITGP